MADQPSFDSLSHDEYEDQVMTGEAVALDLRPTSFVLAAAGATIDFLVYLVGGTLLIFFGILTPLENSPLGKDSDSVGAIVIASEVIVLVVIPIAVELLSRGKSLGRLAVGSRIVRDDGGAIGFRHAFIRGLVAVLEIFTLFGGLAAVIGLVNSRSKRLGDLLAGTYPQYERVGRAAPLAYAVPAPLADWARTADVARIPNRLAQRMAQFLRQAHQLTPMTRDLLARQLANEASAWVSPVPPANPELFVAAVVALRRDREYAALMLERERLDRLESALTGTPYQLPERS
jgi:uncharacterized RDD family membrane protein YckC